MQVIRYAITHVQRDGLRTLTFANQGRHHYETRAAADAALDAFRPSLATRMPGGADPATLKVCAVVCYDHGDAIGTYVDPFVAEPPIGCPECAAWAVAKRKRGIGEPSPDLTCGACGAREVDVYAAADLDYPRAIAAEMSQALRDIGWVVGPVRDTATGAEFTVERGKDRRVKPHVRAFDRRGTMTITRGERS